MNNKVEKAVDLAAWLIKEGNKPPIAFLKASKETGVNRHEIAKACGKRGGTKVSCSKAKKAYIDKYWENINDRYR